MAFFFVGDGTVDVAVAFDDDTEQRFIAWQAQTAAAANENYEASGFRQIVVASSEALQPYGQQWAEDYEPIFAALQARAYAVQETGDRQFDDLPIISGAASDTFGLSGLATAAGQAVIQIVQVDDAGGWKKPFYDRQLREFETTLAEIPQAEAPREAIAEAVAEFVPIAADPRVGETGAKIASMLADLTKAKRRAEVARQVQAIQTEVQRLAQDYRRKRNNEAALMLLIA